MCSLFFVPSRNNNYNNLNNNMEQNFQGDLTDILRGSANNNTSSLINPGYGEPGLTGNNNWQFSSGDDHHNIGISNNFSSLLSTMEDHHHHHQLHDHSAFGDPFSNMRDPLLHDVQQLSSSAVPGPAAFFGGNDAAAAPAAGFFGPSHAVLDQDVKFRPSCNIFSRMLQINPSSAAASTTSATASCGVIPKQVGEAAAAVAAASAQCDSAANSMVAASPRGIIKAGDSMISVGSTQVEGGCSNMAAGGLQISSPRNPGVKRRKSQAKKVVCIPAPAAANSRASGEVVPSDLWAWRKYGQKPIKGSPYPRGYYRCSSSKGCSARKQVERSRTDPNMLVITYTSEHNHPWPTQRNALAGSTRSQPSKSNANNNASSKASPISSAHNQQLGQKNATRSPKDEPNKAENNDNNNASTTPTTSASVKEENVDDQAENGDDQKLLDDSAFSADHCEYDHHDHDHDVGFGYRPALDVNGNDQDFFAGLGQIEADPLNLLFSQDFSSSVDHHQQHHKGIMVTSNNNNNDTKGLDPYFTMFDWSEGNRVKKKRRPKGSPYIPFGKLVDGTES